jgi:hypothetical protein
MKGLLRGFGRREPGETLELSIEGDRYVYLDHLCAGSEQHRLLGVELSEEERASLRVGAPVGLVLELRRLPLGAAGRLSAALLLAGILQ